MRWPTGSDPVGLFWGNGLTNNENKAHYGDRNAGCRLNLLPLSRGQRDHADGSDAGMRRRWDLIIVVAVVVGLLVVAAVRMPSLWGDRSALRMDPAYMQHQKGQIVVEVPELYELLNILVAISPTGQTGPGGYPREHSYYKAVMDWFLPFRDHPLVSVVEKQFNNGYGGMRGSCFAYRFEGDGIVPSYYGEYGGFCEEHRREFEKFARESKFREFYQQNEAFYAEWVRTYRERVDLGGMWRWLETEFPARSDSMRVAVSPLSGGSHNTVGYRDLASGYREIVMFVSHPQEYENPNRPPAVASAMALSGVFTEIDHNYVNPMSDKYRAELKATMPKVGDWNRPPEWANAESYYNSAYATFNEYLTWAAFLVYAAERYDAPTFEQVTKEHVRVMEYRGFVKYDEFQRRLMALYQERNSGETLADLYPQLLEMVRGMN